MHRVLASELSSHIGERVKISGWVHNLRLLGKANFLIARDASGLTQVFLFGSEREQVTGRCRKA